MRRDLVLILSLSVVTACLLALSGWALGERFEDTNERRLQQAAFNQKLEEVVLQNCWEIEKLKASRREQAQASYDNRHRDFELLGLRLTPEVEKVLLDSLNTNLRRFRAEPCPRPTGGTP